LVLASSSCGGRSDDGSNAGCRKDTDCKGDRICVFGTCEDPKRDSEDEAEDEDSESMTVEVSDGDFDAGSSSSSEQVDEDTDDTSSSNAVSSQGSDDDGEAADGDDSDDAASIEATATEVLATAIIGDVERGLVYAVVEGGAEEFPNSLVTIDAHDGSVLHDVSIGSNPDSLAISDDGSTLWVGLHGEYAVRKVDLKGGQPDPGETYTLPPADFGDLAAAGPMVVLPGTADTLAISMHRDGVSPSFGGAVVLDDGVPRPTQTRGHTGASRLTSGPEGYLFGYNNLHTGYEFWSITVDDEGLTQEEFRDLVSGFSTDIVYEDGYVFATSGELVDVSDPTLPVRAGQFTYSGLIVPDVDNGVAWMLSAGDSFPSSTDDMMLRLLEIETVTQLTAYPVEAATEAAPSRFVRTSANTFAYLSAGVHLLEQP
jgi:hypothetical protein